MTSGEIPKREPTPEELDAQRLAKGRWLLEELGEAEIAERPIPFHSSTDGHQLTVGEWVLVYDYPRYKERIEPFILRYEHMAPDDPDREQYKKGLRDMLYYYLSQSQGA